jgi:SAM-dependent methyltransferase
VSTAAADLGPILRDLELEQIPVLERADTANTAAGDIAAVAADGRVLLRFAGAVSDRELAAVRDRLWPDWHVSAVYRVDADGKIARQAQSGAAPIDGRLSGGPSAMLYVRSRDLALGRDSTRAKFDLNAKGWNGQPGTRTYGHFRWMRRLLADVARPTRGTRVLDAGCGAGWVGIEAALKGAMASAFDPSPAMVENAKQNAAECGVDLDARVGFVEDVPFDRPFELVLNSGVISFAPDADVYLGTLDRLVEPGGLLVIGDLNPSSYGFARRRRRPILPARELNGQRRSDVEQHLVQRGYTIEGRWYYQLTFPLPELMALSEQRISGFGAGLALALNKLATATDHALGSRFERRFDSWILRARKGS